MPAWPDARQSRALTRVAQLSVRIAGRCTVGGCITDRSRRDWCAGGWGWASRISRSVSNVCLPLFWVALSEACPETRTPRNRRTEVLVTPLQHTWELDTDTLRRHP